MWDAYLYDNNGNIIYAESYLSDKYTKYTYDDLGQLIREDNKFLNVTYLYEYDNAGNITAVKRCNFTTGSSPTVLETKTYTYSASGWGDLLTAYNGAQITYDSIGNPLTYNNGTAYTFTWNGRQLVGATKSGNTYSFTYNDSGYRTSKTVNGVTTTYYLNGSMIMAEETNGNMTVYLYDTTGLPIGVQYHKATDDESTWEIYWFEKNLQGDIISVYNESGTKLISYQYDAWGNAITSYFNGGENTNAVKNPFTYRGYYYDADLEMYYLGSRCYDSVVKRFINSDSALYHSMYGYNMYTYCNNNPVNYCDPYGESAVALILSGFGCAVIDGPLPFGDIAGLVLIIIAGVQIISDLCDINVSHTDTTPAESAPQSVVQPPETSEDVPEVDGNGNPVVKPGQIPTKKDGYIVPKKGPKWDKEKKGWEDKYGNVWVPAPTGTPSAHGGGHWDVQSPNGGYRNVYPGGKVSGGRPPYPHIPIFKIGGIINATIRN